ncbi:unnamed protein product [Rotaria socialis]|uniref:ADP-ribosylhydrolase ARH3 n=1 Tax=Rotaria socialis TaxID=392032 RepID=A0A821JKZ7_9BILA|nr:unnamed protein product [Rotaria socialis]
MYCLFVDKPWLKYQFTDVHRKLIKKPDELECEMKDPTANIDKIVLDKTLGSLMGLALGDALDAHVEFRSHEYLQANLVKNLKGGGTWGLDNGQFTDDTSMALYLATSLIARRDFVAYDQLVRYKWWYQYGYMSSTGQRFDIDSATKQSLVRFAKNQKDFANKNNIPIQYMDFLSNRDCLRKFSVYCSEVGAAGNEALMRLAPVPLFFYRNPENLLNTQASVVKLLMVMPKPMMQAALWAFWSDENSFEIGALKAVNLGDDTGTTAAIYGQLAGAYYGFKELPRKWIEHVYAKRFIECLSKWVVYEGENWPHNQIDNDNDDDDDQIEDMNSVGQTSENLRPRRDTVATCAYHIEAANRINYDDAIGCNLKMSQSSRRASTDISNNNNEVCVTSTLVHASHSPPGKSVRRTSHRHIFDASSLKSTEHA